MFDIIIVAGFGMLIGLNVGVLLGYILNSQRNSKAPVAQQAPEKPEKQEKQEDAPDAPETSETSNFWSQPADNLE